jgi:hypothetical protein
LVTRRRSDSPSCPTTGSENGGFDPSLVVGDNTDEGNDSITVVTSGQ